MLLPFSQILSEHKNIQERLGKLRTERPKDIRLQTVHTLFFPPLFRSLALAVNSVFSMSRHQQQKCKPVNTESPEPGK